MLCQSLVTRVVHGFLAIGFVNPTFEVIGDQQFRNSAQKAQAPTVGVEPGCHILSFTGIDVDVVGRLHDRATKMTAQHSSPALDSPLTSTCQVPKFRA
ncbi:Uncharacterised protein [Budvicia aquatica]|uniref:Uncharacterized protein n=1 Tax=Budvicia aquatica TaxID=82979 RepID=A0A484ZQP1_9GAMM|nr:Uncharacterised protein [Budvicia aquatica]